MAIGTSLGAYFESAFHHQAGIETPITPKDGMDITPDDFMGNKGIAADPDNVFDDQGNIVDYQDPMSIINQDTLTPSDRQ